MTTPAWANIHVRRRFLRTRRTGRQDQRGVVLIISLIMILVISVLAATSMRNVASSEGLSGNVRTTELATQAADIALRHCELSVVKHMDGVAILATDVPAAGIVAAGSGTWKNLATWDSTSTPFQLDTQFVGGTATFARPPECMVELLAGTVGTRPASFIVTARGFGPEVRTAVGAGRPVGTVVWLQSTLDMQ